MPESLHRHLSMIIACPLGLILNIWFPMFTPKMVSQKRLLVDRTNLGNTHQASIFCVGLCNLASSHVGPIEAHCYPTLFGVTAGDWVRT